MYLRSNRRLKDGKEHRYWNIVESKRCAGGKVVQRQVLYLGEINDSQRESWCRVIEAFELSPQHHADFLQQILRRVEIVHEREDERANPSGIGV